MRIAIPGERVQEEVERAYRTLQKSVQIPGFRRGRVPRPVLRARYGESVRSEVLEDLVVKALNEAIEERQLEVVGEIELNPDLEEMQLPEDGSDLEFVADLEVRPEIPLPELSELQVDKTPVDVPEEEVDRFLERLREAYAELVDPEEPRPAQEGDVVFTDWKLFREDREEPITQQENYAVELGTGQVLEEIERTLLGAQVGETREAQITYPEDYPNPELAGKTARMLLTVKRIAEKRLPELDDEFAKTLNYESLQALRAAQWNRLVEARKRQKREQQRQDLLNQLIERADFPVPESLVQRQARYLAALELRRREESGQSVQEVDFQALVESHREQAERSIREEWILEEIARRERIEVSDAEVRAVVVAEARGRGEDPDQLEDRLRQEGRWESYRQALRDARVVELLIERAAQRPTIVTP